jgi:hypothetical protein
MKLRLHASKVQDLQMGNRSAPKSRSEWCVWLWLPTSVLSWSEPTGTCRNPTFKATTQQKVQKMAYSTLKSHSHTSHDVLLYSYLVSCLYRISPSLTVQSTFNMHPKSRNRSTVLIVTGYLWMTIYDSLRTDEACYTAGTNNDRYSDHWCSGLQGRFCYRWCTSIVKLSMLSTPILGDGPHE